MSKALILTIYFLFINTCYSASYRINTHIPENKRVGYLQDQSRKNREQRERQAALERLQKRQVESQFQSQAQNYNIYKRHTPVYIAPVPVTFDLLFDEVIMMDGTTLLNVRPQRIENDKLVVFCSSGIKNINLHNLPDNVRTNIGLLSYAQVELQREVEEEEQEAERLRQVEQDNREARIRVAKAKEVEQKRIEREQEEAIEAEKERKERFEYNREVSRQISIDIESAKPKERKIHYFPLICGIILLVAIMSAIYYLSKND